MDALTKAFNSQQRSYQSAKASVSSLTSELLSSGRNSSHRKPDFSKASEQYAFFRGEVYSCVKAISSKIAGQQLHAGTLSKPGRTKPAVLPEVEEFTTHPVLDLFANPSALQVTWSLLFNTVASLAA